MCDKRAKLKKQASSPVFMRVIFVTQGCASKKPVFMRVTDSLARLARFL